MLYYGATTLFHARERDAMLLMRETPRHERA